VTLRYYIQALRKRWLTIVAFAVLGVALAIGFTAVSNPVYTAKATSFVHMAGQGSQAQNGQVAESLVQSYPDVVHSPAVLSPVIRDLKLDLTIRQLDQKITAANPPGTFLLTVQATDGSARQAQRIANAVASNLAREIDKLESASSPKNAAVSVTVTTPAALPTSPTSPRPTLNVLLGLLAGLAIGICAAIVRDQMDLTVKSIEDLRRLSGASPLGTIRNDAEFQIKPLVATHEHSFGIEDFRSIRTNLQFVDVDSPPRLIVVSSAVAEEGKTVASCNIATTMAQADLKVCLVEGDLRRPRATSYLGLDGTIGLTDVVAGTHELDNVLIPWHRGLVTVLPAGTTPPDPAQFLGSKAMRNLITELRERFDLIIIDAPPLLPVSDAAVLGALADGVILVARHRHVRRDQFTSAIASLDAVNAKLLGTVLTRVPARRRHGYYDDYRNLHEPVELRPAAESSVAEAPIDEFTESTPEEVGQRTSAHENENSHAVAGGPKVGRSVRSSRPDVASSRDADESEPAKPRSHEQSRPAQVAVSDPRRSGRPR
jgi:capsular exopolysaccharide synthesis family protein